MSQLPKLLKILELGCLRNSALNRFESVVSAALSPIFSMALTSEKNYITVVAALESWKSEKGDAFPNISMVNDQLKRITEQYYMNKARASTIEDVKRKLQALEK